MKSLKKTNGRDGKTNLILLSPQLRQVPPKVKQLLVPQRALRQFKSPKAIRKGKQDKSGIALPSALKRVLGFFSRSHPPTE